MEKFLKSNISHPKIILREICANADRIRSYVDMFRTGQANGMNSDVRAVHILRAGSGHPNNNIGMRI